MKLLKSGPSSSLWSEPQRALHLGYNEAICSLVPADQYGQRLPHLRGYNESICNMFPAVHCSQRSPQLGGYNETICSLFPTVH